MTWNKDGMKWQLYSTWQVELSELGLVYVHVRFVDHWNNKLVVTIYDELDENGILANGIEAYCKKWPSGSVPEPLATFNFRGHAFELRLTHPSAIQDEDQSIELIIDGSDDDEPPEHSTAEILADANLAEYIGVFLSHAIESEADMRMLTDQQMVELGVTKIGDRNRLRSHFMPAPLKEDTNAHEDATNARGNNNSFVEGAKHAVGQEVGAQLFSALFSA